MYVVEKYDGWENILIGPFLTRDLAEDYTLSQEALDDLEWDYTVIELEEPK